METDKDKEQNKGNSDTGNKINWDDRQNNKEKHNFLSSLFSFI